MQLAGSYTKWMLAAAFVLSWLGLPTSALAQRYQQINLVSDLPYIAAWMDTHLKNSWGIAFPPGGPFWIADNGTGLSTLYKGDGTPLSLVVTVPPPMGAMGPSAPSGLVFNGTGDFMVSENGKMGPSLFIFDTENGTISGWNFGVDLTNAILAVDNSQSGAVYKGNDPVGEEALRDESPLGLGGNLRQQVSLDRFVHRHDGPAAVRAVRDSEHQRRVVCNVC